MRKGDRLKSQIASAVAKDWSAKAGTIVETEPEVDMVNHPPHYNQHPSGIECIEIVRELPHCLGSATKYVWRYEDKSDPIEDLDKALWYLNDVLGHDSAGVPPTTPKFQDRINKVIRVERKINPMRALYFSHLLIPGKSNIPVMMEFIEDMKAEIVGDDTAWEVTR